MSTFFAFILAVIVVSIIRIHAFKGTNPGAFIIDIIIAAILVSFFKGC